MGQWDLNLPPAGIDDEWSRAALRLLNARFDALPIERVLVWHLATVVEEALPHLSEPLGLADLSFVGGPPREFIASALELLRRRGTPQGLEDALALLGYVAPNVTLEERPARRHDGTLDRRGEPARHGGDYRWYVVFVHLTVPAPLSAERLREAWDVCVLMRAKRNRIVLVVQAPAVAPVVVRSRAEIA